ncbi:hypothetical protein [Anaeromyxobacter oryzisoli]|uniref:hypothetical protein n=1 Tax=Anaeromyxobacter oryzisoli TaxID=2925408 RepID=UPI001F5ABFD6|nr:hypothetical protein [Anaeromyxobacter sp. SG63]
MLVELPVQALRYAGAIKAPLGFMVVLLSSVYASYGYGSMRDRRDGVLGAAVAGIAEATFGAAGISAACGGPSAQ